MTVDIQAVLSCPLEENDSGAYTVKGYLKALLFTLWDEDEGFSGKRPFGNSGWECDLTEPLIVNKLAQTNSEAKKLIFKAIQAL